MARIEIDPNYSSPTFSRATAGPDLFKKEDLQALAAAMSTHDHAIGKGLPVGLVANGAITSAMIAPGTVTGGVGGNIASQTITSGNIAAATIVGANLVNDTIGAQQIAPGAVGLSELAADIISQSFIAAGATGNPTTTSSTMADCPDMIVNITGRGGDVLVWFAITLQHSAAGGLGGIQIALDGVDSTVAMAGSCPSASGLFMLMNMLRLSTVTGGRVIKGRWANLSGTGTLTGNSIARLLVVQEIRR